MRTGGFRKIENIEKQMVQHLSKKGVIKKGNHIDE